MPAIRILLFCLTLLIWLSPAKEARGCSPVEADTVDAPSNEKNYDAALSPSAPTVLSASLYSHQSSACASDDCGSLDSLRLDVQVPVGTALLRVDIEGQPTTYLSPVNRPTGQEWNLLEYGYEEFDSLAIEVRAINSEGYLSQPAAFVASSDRGASGCSAAGNTGAATWVLLACLLLGYRTRRRKSAIA